jgi:hypothetical protein
MRIQRTEPPITGWQLLDIDTVTSEVHAGTRQRSQPNKPVYWRFTTEEARIKLKRLYPKLSD